MPREEAGKIERVVRFGLCITCFFYGIYPQNSDTTKSALIILIFEQCGFTIELSKNADRIVNSDDPDQQSDLGLNCLPRHLCPKSFWRALVVQ